MSHKIFIKWNYKNKCNFKKIRICMQNWVSQEKYIKLPIFWKKFSFRKRKKCSSSKKKKSEKKFVKKLSNSFSSYKNKSRVYIFVNLPNSGLICFIWWCKFESGRFASLSFSSTSIAPEAKSGSVLRFSIATVTLELESADVPELGEKVSSVSLLVLLELCPWAVFCPEFGGNLKISE